jgi:plastocyanin domain-containing protein
MNFAKRMLTTAGLALAAGLLVPTTQAKADSSHHETTVEIEIIVKGGYQPNRVEIVQGQHVKLKFLRKESSGCSREVVFPALGIRKELPQGEPVVIQLPKLDPGEYEFTCGMNMIRGKLIVRPKR